jgi:hypothetical protein
MFSSHTDYIFLGTSTRNKALTGINELFRGPITTTTMPQHWTGRCTLSRRDMSYIVSCSKLRALHRCSVVPSKSVVCVGRNGQQYFSTEHTRNLPMHHCLTSLLTWQSSCLTDRLTISVTAMTYAHDFPQPWGCFVAPLSESLVSLVGSFIGPFSPAWTVVMGVFGSPCTPKTLAPPCPALFFPTLSFPPPSLCRKVFSWRKQKQFTTPCTLPRRKTFTNTCSWQQTPVPMLLAHTCTQVHWLSQSQPPASGWLVRETNVSTCTWQPR